MANKKFLPVAGALIVFASLAFAHDLEKYPFKMNAAILHSLRPDKTATALVKAGMSSAMVTENEVRMDNKDTIVTDGFLIGTYRARGYDLPLEVEGRVDQGRLSARRTPTEIKWLLAAWEKRYRAPVEIAALTPRLQTISYHDGQGFLFDYALTGAFEYTLLFDAAVSTSTLRMADRAADLSTMKRFIAELENDPDYRAVLSRNPPKTPIYLLFDLGRAKCHCVGHDIYWDPASRAWRFDFFDKYAAAQDVAVLQPLFAVPELKAFFDRHNQNVTFKTFGAAEDYQGSLASADGAKEWIAVRVERGIVTIQKNSGFDDPAPKK